jgi:hypothetical protein
MENARAILSLENWLNYSLDNFDSIVKDEEKRNMMKIVIKKMPETFYTNFFHILTVNENGYKMKKFILSDNELTSLFSEYLDDVSGLTDRDRVLSDSEFTDTIDKLYKIFNSTSAQLKDKYKEYNDFRKLDMDKYKLDK